MTMTRLSSLLHNIPQKTLKRAYIIRLAVYMPLVMIIVFFAFFRSYTIQMNNLIVKQQAVLDFVKVSMTNELAFLVNDANYVKDIREIKAYLMDKQGVNKTMLETRLLAYALDRNIYTQIEVLDMSGYQLFRINQVAPMEYVIADEDQLQYKGDSNYFEHTIGLEDGRVSFSEFDFNTEKDAIEGPINPVIRISTGLYNDKGEQLGVIVLNYFGKELLARMDIRNAEDGNFKIFLINREGYYLNHETPEKNWGFINSNNSTLKIEQPALYEEIIGQESGTIIQQGMTYIFDSFSLDHNYHMGTKYEGAFTYLVSYSHRQFFEFIHLGTFIVTTLVMMIATPFFLLMVTKWQVSRAYIESMYSLIYMGIEKSPTVFVLTDEEGDMLYVNEKFESVTGYAYEEVLYANPRILKSGEMSEEAYKSMWATISSGRTWEGEVHNKRKNGSFYWAYVKISSIKNKYGEITHYLASQEDVTEKKFLQERLMELTKTDDLTQIYNKRYLSQIMDEESAHELGDVYTLMMLDIDHFKVVNDHYGHLAGDKVLEEVSLKMKAQLRESDSQFRYGGEEFLALLPDTEMATCLQVGERIRSSIESAVFVVDDQDIKVTISIGCTQRIEGESLQDVIKRADKAMYKAKENGRNRVEQAPLEFE